MKFFSRLAATTLLLFINLFNAFVYPQDVLALPDNFFKSTLAEGFNEPTDFDIASDGTIFIIEKAGMIKIIKNGAVSNFINSPLPVNSQGERGLLGLTLDPNFNNNRSIYIFYVNNNPLEYHISKITESNGKMVVGSEIVIFKTSTNPDGKTHIGGGLNYGPDGKLWFTIGDNTLDTVKEPQKLTSPYGKLHRINLDGSIPEDNPYFGQSEKVQSIYSFGLRNPFRFSFMTNGNPIIGDVGGDLFEEVNIGVAGGNFGWPDCEGPCNNPGFVNPIYYYQHSDNGASITGGFFYKGNDFPEEFKNDYFFGDFVNRFIKRLDFDASGNLIGEKSFDDGAGTVVSLKQGSDGSLYFLNIYPGSLSKIQFSTENQPPVAKASASPLFGDSPLLVNFNSNGSSDPEGSTLIYEWDFGDGIKSSEANPTHNYQNSGKYIASLVVSDGNLKSQPVTIQIQVGNLAPEITSMNPVDGAKYNAGDVINFSANATDREDENLPASSYFWKILFHHETHTHPYAEFNGVKSGQFKINDSVERSPDTYYEISLTVTDSAGLKTTKIVNVYPNKINLLIDSNIPNMVVKLNGIPYATPLNIQAVVNFKLTIEAVSPLIREGKDYEFKNWSDGGERIHVLTIPNSDLKVTANYEQITSNIKSVTKFSVVAGDIKVKGTPLYDNDSSTGLVTLFEEDSEIETPWGASIITNIDLPAAENTLKAVSDEIKAKGCGGSCNSVTTLIIPKDMPPPTFVMTAGEKKTVAKYSLIEGDIKVLGQDQYDSDPKTGLIIIMEDGGEVEAEWGASVVGNKDMETALSKVDSTIARLIQSGCSGGCDSVKVVQWQDHGGHEH